MWAEARPAVATPGRDPSTAAGWPVSDSISRRLFNRVMKMRAEAPPGAAVSWSAPWETRDSPALLGRSTDHPFAAGPGVTVLCRLLRPILRLCCCAEVLDAAVKPVDHHLGGRMRRCQLLDVGESVGQRSVLVEIKAAVAAHPRAVLVFYNAEVPGHRVILCEEEAVHAVPKVPNRDIRSWVPLTSAAESG